MVFLFVLPELKIELVAFALKISFRSSKEASSFFFAVFSQNLHNGNTLDNLHGIITYCPVIFPFPEIRQPGIS